MQIDGYLNANDEPIIRLAVGTLSIEALIDTGFDGHLIIPGELADRMSVRFEGNQELCSVTGAPFLTSTCLMEIDWLGKRIRVPIMASSEVGESLLGSHMLRGCCLTIDYGNRIVKIIPSESPN